MTSNQKTLTPLFFALIVFAASTLLLMTGKRPRYDEYDRLMW